MSNAWPMSAITISAQTGLWFTVKELQRRDGSMSEWLSTDDPRLSRVKQKREAILAEVGHTHLATVYWPGEKGPWHTTYDRKPLNGQVTRWQVWIGEDGARRRVLG